jgi:hypothetical protein
LEDEIFFLLYHTGLDPEKTLNLPVKRRISLINKFIEQRNKENEAIAKKTKKSR